MKKELDELVAKAKIEWDETCKFGHPSKAARDGFISAWIRKAYLAGLESRVSHTPELATANDVFLGKFSIGDMVCRKCLRIGRESMLSEADGREA